MPPKPAITHSSTARQPHLHTIRRSKIRVILWFLAGVLLAHAQTNLAAIAGLICDPGTNAVPGARMRALSAETSAVRLSSGPSRNRPLPAGSFR